MRYDLWQTEREKAEVMECGLKVLKDTSLNGKACLKMWRPKAVKPFVNYYFQTPEHRETYIAQQVESFQASKARKEEWKAARRGTAEDLAKVKVGDLFYSSWGYDQTNINFFQVVKVKGRHAWICEVERHSSLDNRNDGGSNMSRYVMPAPNKFTGTESKKLIQFSGGQPYFHWTSYASIYPFNGKAKYESWYA